jgi:hypothetical protein
VVAAPPPPRRTCAAALAATLGADASIGAAPDLAAGVTAGVELRSCDLSIAVEGQGSAPASRSVAGGGQVSSWAVLGAVVPCAYFGPFLGCAVAQGGALRVSSGGVADPRAEGTTAWAAGIRAGVLVPLTEAAFVRVRSDFLVAIEPIRLILHGEPAWVAPSVESTLGLDLGVRFR